MTEIALVIIKKSVHRATKILDILYTLHSADMVPIKTADQ